MTGKYRGAAHRTCNINNRQPNYIPVLFHNLSNYDLHHLIKYLVKMKDIKDPVRVWHADT
jgi:hypothetical protein